MRKKIAKRKRRELLAAGCAIDKEYFSKESGWRRKDCGYILDFTSPDGVHWCCMEKDMLAAYQLALWGLELGKEPGARRKWRRPYRTPVEPNQ